jgi:hypothetical protein
MQLTDNQRRHLTVFLAQVEDAIVSLEWLAAARPHPRALRTDHQDLPHGFASAIQEELAPIRAGLAELAETFGLQPLGRSRAQEALGLLTIAIVQVEEAGSRGLRGYGEVDPEVPAVLDPALGRLRAALARVAGRLSEQGAKGAPG